MIRKNKLAISTYSAEFLDAIMMTNEVGTNNKKVSLYKNGHDRLISK